MDDRCASAFYWSSTTFSSSGPTAAWGVEFLGSAVFGYTKLAFGAGGDAGKGKASAAGANNAGKGQTALPTGVAAALSGSTTPTMQLVTDEASASARRSRK